MNLESLSMWHDWGGRPEVNLHFEYSSACLQLVLLSHSVDVNRVPIALKHFRKYLSPTYTESPQQVLRD